MSEKWHGGKGDKQRPTDKDKYAEGWERIFGNKDKDKEDTQEPPVEQEDE